MNVKKDIFWRVYLSFIFVIIMAIAISVQIFRIQYVQGSHWKGLAETSTTVYREIEPVRGNIYSADGSLMAASVPIYEIRFDVNVEALTDNVFYTHLDSLAFHLSNYFKDKSAAAYRRELVQARDNGARYHLIRRRVNHNQLKEIREFPIFRKGRYRGGFIVEQRSIRIKPFQLLAERTIGYRVPDVMPVGLEGAFDEYLAGEAGKRLMQRVSGGDWIPINDQNELEPRDGMDIITTIDMNIQDITESALLRAMRRHKASHGSAVVMDVKTGDIKAIANLGRTSAGNYIEDYNYAVGESTEPGSTFKLATVLALIESGKVKPDDIFDTEDGTTRFHDRTMRDHDEDGFGKINLNEAFALSSNVAISKAVHENFASEPMQFIEELRKANLHLPLGIPITGEGSPLIKSPSDRDWSGTTLPWMSIGYEVKMTPLQILTLYNAVANNGRMVKPRFVTEVRDVGKAVTQFPVEVIKERIATRQTIKQLQEMLEEVVKTGTATNIRSNQYDIAGKTGTALVAAAGGYRGEQGKHYQASFAGYFPADNPKYSIMVVVSGPSQGIYYGSSVAGPVFKEISDKVFAGSFELQLAVSQNREEEELKEPHLLALSPGYQADLETLCRMLAMPCHLNSSEHFWRTPVRTDSLLVLTASSIEKQKVPDVRGMVLSDAIYLLENKGLNVKTRGYGRVAMQSVRPGTEIIQPGREIHLSLN